MTRQERSAKKKLIRVTTIDGSLYGLLKGQLKFLNTEYEVIGVANDGGNLDKVAEREGIRTIGVPMAREISIKQDVCSLVNLIRLFIKEKPYIVHANTPKGSLLAMIAAWVARVPNRIYTVTGLRFETTTGRFRTLLKTMERVTCACATKVIPEGDGVKDTLIREHITSKPLQKVLNGNINGIDVKHFSAEETPKSREVMRKQLGIGEDEFAFVFVGRIVKDKGMNELCDAMRRLKADKCNAKLILVGRFESKLDPIVAENEDFLKNDECVSFAGYQNDVRPYLLAADALVFPSYREGFPNVVLQAGAMGLPSIVTDINGCNEIVIDNVNGVIIKKQNTEELYNAMRHFINHREEVAEMAGKARNLIVTRYEQHDVWKAMLSEYKKLD